MSAGVGTRFGNGKGIMIQPETERDVLLAVIAANYERLRIIAESTRRLSDKITLEGWKRSLKRMRTTQARVAAAR